MSIADPTSPYTVATFPTGGLVRGVALEDTFIYLYEDNMDFTDTLIVVNGSDLASLERIASRPLRHPLWKLKPAGLWAQDGMLYVCSKTDGVLIFDCSSLPAIDSAGAISGEEYGEAYDVLVIGTTAYVASGSGASAPSTSPTPEPRRNSLTTRPPSGPCRSGPGVTSSTWPICTAGCTPWNIWPRRYAGMRTGVVRSRPPTGTRS